MELVVFVCLSHCMPSSESNFVFVSVLSKNTKNQIVICIRYWFCMLFPLNERVSRGYVMRHINREQNIQTRTYKLCKKKINKDHFSSLHFEYKWIYVVVFLAGRKSILPNRLIEKWNKKLFRHGTENHIWKHICRINVSSAIFQIL